MDSQLSHLLDRFQLRITSQGGRANAATWMEQNLTHPKNSREKWNFKGHEYQRQIASDVAPFVSVIKSSQVGVSQLFANVALAMVALHPGETFIYVLPTTSFARRFTNSRLNPIIDSSPLLKDLVDKNTDSTELKKLGSSFLFVVGAQKQGQAISIPAMGVITDEKDFCNPTVLTTFRSRLTHTAPERRVQVAFSTPTVPGLGISRDYEEGNGFVYMLLHDKCNQWTILDPIFDIQIPGFDGSLLTWTKQDLADPRIKSKDAWVKCQCCGKPVSRENITNPEKRAWVAKRPGVEKHSYYVSPLDAEASSNPIDIVESVDNYNRIDDYLNFGLGVPFQSSENSITSEAIENSCSGMSVRPSKNCMYGTGLGMDVGKVSHLTVMKPEGGKYRVVWAEKIKQKIRADGQDETTETAVQRINEYGAARAVVDAAPDITVPSKIIQRSIYGAAWAAYFVRTIKGMENFSLKEEDQFVNIARTEMIDAFTKDFNGGKIILPRDSGELTGIKQHLGRLKRIRRVSETTGEDSAAWVSTSDEDHWAFSLIYAYTACQMFSAGAAAVYPIASRLITKVRTQVA